MKKSMKQGPGGIARIPTVPDIYLKLGVRSKKCEDAYCPYQHAYSAPFTRTVVTVVCNVSTAHLQAWRDRFLSHVATPAGRPHPSTPFFFFFF